LVAFHPTDASALPSFARQTGQTCATCHTALPELTPFGRQFKLNGYTAGGTRCGENALSSKQVPIAAMTMPYTFTHVKDKNVLEDPSKNDYQAAQENSIFIAGQIYCDLGAFAQITYTHPEKLLHWDNFDIRYTKNMKIGGLDTVFGITTNNNPTAQDAWNTVPAWSWPFMSTGMPGAPGPSAATMIEDTLGQQVAGAGAYVWINNMFYAELSDYKTLDSTFLQRVGADPAGPRISGMAPYWRFAFEKTMDEHSFMLGTFGMVADLQSVNEDSPFTVKAPGLVDRYTDIGVDAQYQYLGQVHAVTARASYIWEKAKLDASVFNGDADNLSNSLQSFKASTSYIYDRTYSLTGGYFDVHGSADATLWGGSPNSSGWTGEVAYLPFSHGGPSEWPWLNARIGLNYTHYDEIDGERAGASKNDTTYLYTWVAF
jgi:hypothetical protein